MERAELTFAVGLCFLVVSTSNAQTRESQAWSDFTLGRNFAAVYMAELEVGYQSLLAGDPQWSTLSVTPTLEASYSPNFDLISGVPWMETRQDDDTRTREYRFQLGGRYHVLPFKRVQPRLTYRFEERFFRTLEPEPHKSQSSRSRLNIAVWVPIDRPRMSNDTLWYAFVDYEFFVVHDEQLQERFANLSIARIALARKFSYNWRLELIYSLMRSRDEVDEERNDQDLDQIYRLSLKYYITPPNRWVPKPAVGG